MNVWLSAVGVLFYLSGTLADEYITVSSSGQCRDVDLSLSEKLYIDYYGANMFDDCKIGISGTLSDKICVSTVSYSLDNCGAWDSPKSSFKLKYFDGTSTWLPEKTYGCDEDTLYSSSEWCTSFGEATISIEGIHAGNTNFRLKVYLEDTFDGLDTAVNTAVVGVAIIIAIVIGGIVLVVVTIVVIVCCVCNRRRSNAGTVYRSPAAQTQATTVTAPTTGAYPLQPQATAYPAQPPQGYPAQPPQGYQGQPVASGYQPPPTGYQPPPTGYQPPPAGYQPTQTGYQPQPAHPPPTEKGFEKNVNPTAPAEGDLNEPPPYPGY